jgi:transcription elongation factor GreB
MSRYRAPRPSSTALITPLGHRLLADELKRLWKEERPLLTRRVAEAAAQGDRSENAEYIYGKKALREIDARIRYLTKRLDELVVVDRAPADVARVYFGAWVTVTDDSGAQQTYRIVGADELSRCRDYISIDSPLARALLGKRCGDAVAVARPSGTLTLRLTEIDYGDTETT